MPEGSSSAAPVMRPGPSSRSRDLTRSPPLFWRGRYGRGFSRRSERIPSPLLSGVNESSIAPAQKHSLGHADDPRPGRCTIDAEKTPLGAFFLFDLTTCGAFVLDSAIPVRVVSSFRERDGLSPCPFPRPISRSFVAS